MKNSKPIWDIQTVLILRENLPFLNEWLQYHFDLGCRNIVIYDNTNSEKIEKNYNYESIKTTGNTKYKYPASLLYSGKNDDDLLKEAFKIFSNFGDKVIYKKWQPKKWGKIVYAQVEAFNNWVKLILNERKVGKNEWCFFIDTDEFIVPKVGSNVENFLSGDKITIMQKKFDCRFKLIKGSQPFCVSGITKELLINTKNWAEKSAVKYISYNGIKPIFMGLRRVTPHTIRIKANCQEMNIKPSELCFFHYNFNKVQLAWLKNNLSRFEANKKFEDLEYTTNNSLEVWSKKYLTNKNIPLWDEKEFDSFRKECNKLVIW